MHFIKIEVHFVGYLYIMDLINAWKMEYIIILLLLLLLLFVNMRYSVEQRDIIVGSYTRNKSYKAVANLEVSFPVFLFIQNQ
jgi:hypothetical protein